MADETRDDKPVSGPEWYRAQGVDMVILGSGMFHRFYDNPPAFARQIGVYDAFFEEIPDLLAFESAYDPLAFRAGGLQVYVFFLTERAKKLNRK